jgi:hypothetical protein
MTMMRRFAAVALLAVLASGAAWAEATLQTIHFAAGKSAATVHGGIVRGDAVIYALTAKQGQEADIRVTSLENNADLMIYQPPAQLVHSDDGLDVAGPPLPGGDKVPGLDAGATRHWHGALPGSGTYYIVVSGDRGNVTYDLMVSVR